MLTIILHTQEAFAISQATLWQCGIYKGYTVYQCSLGYFLTAPGSREAVQFAGQAVFTASPQEAGELVNLLLSAPPGSSARQKRTGAAAKQRRSAAAQHPSPRPARPDGRRADRART